MHHKSVHPLVEGPLAAVEDPLEERRAVYTEHRVRSERSARDMAVARTQAAVETGSSVETGSVVETGSAVDRSPTGLHTDH